MSGSDTYSSSTTALLSDVKPAARSSDCEIDYCYRLIHRVFLDLREASRLQSLLTVQSAIHCDGAKSDDIQGTVASLETALEALILQINRLAAPPSHSNNPLLYLKHALQRRTLVLTPQIQLELQICHTALLRSIARMHTWADASEKEAVGEVRRGLVAGESAFGDLDEVLRSPYARRRTRQQRATATNDRTLPYAGQQTAASALRIVSEEKTGGLHRLSHSAAVSHADPRGTVRDRASRQANEEMGHKMTSLKCLAHHGAFGRGRFMSGAEQRDCAECWPDRMSMSLDGRMPLTTGVPDGSNDTSPASANLSLCPVLSHETNRSAVSLLSPSYHSSMGVDDDLVSRSGPHSGSDGIAKANSLYAVSALDLSSTSRETLNHSYRPGAYGAVEMDSNASPRATVLSMEGLNRSGDDLGRPRSYERTNWSDVPILADTRLADMADIEKAAMVRHALPADEHLPEVCTDTRSSMLHQTRGHRQTGIITASSEKQHDTSHSHRNAHTARKARRALLEAG